MDQDENDSKPTTRVRSSSISSYKSNNNNNNSDIRSSIPEDKLVESIYRHLMESICQDVASNMHKLIKTGADDVIPSSWKLFSSTQVPTRRDLYPELYNGNENHKDDDENDVEKDDTTNGESKPINKRKSDEEIRALLEKYAVDLPKSSSPSSSSSNNNNKRIKRDMAEEEEKMRLLKKLQKEKQSGYKDSEDEDEDNETIDDDEEDKDDEDFKMDDDDEEEQGEEDDDTRSKSKTKNRSLSTTSETPSTSTAEAASETATKYVTKLDIWGKNPSKEPKNRLCRCQLCGRLISTSRFASHLDKCMGLSTSRNGTTPGSSLSKPVMGATKKRNGGSR